MKANELMIGDWVMVNDIEHTHPLQVTELFMKSGTLYATLYWDGMPDNVNPETLTADVDKVLPIPLTAEIFEKNGFIRYGTSYILKESMFELTNPSNPDRYLDNYYIRLARQNKRVMYVHKLQHFMREFGIEKEIVI